MKNEEPICNDEKTCFDDKNINSNTNSNEDTVFEEEKVNTENASTDNVKQSKKSTITKVSLASGGMGILLGATTSFVLADDNTDNVEHINTGSDEDDEIVNNEMNNSVSTQTSQCVWADAEINVASGVTDDMSFSQAFAAARAEVGSGGAFEWRGNIYSTYYANEWDNMTQEERDEYGSHFNWNSSSDEENDSQQTTDSDNENVTDGGEIANDTGDDSEGEIIADVITPDTGGEVPDNINDTDNASEGDVTIEEIIPDNESDVLVMDTIPVVEVLGTVYNEDLGADVGVMTVDGQEVFLIDIPGIGDDGNFDVMVSDINQDGVITENEILNIQNEQISVNQFESNAFGDTAMYESTDDYQDYTNDISSDDVVF